MNGAKTFGYLEKYILGLLSDVKRKSIEPIALAAGVAVRTVQEFLASFQWDEEQAGQVHLVDTRQPHTGSVPTDRTYWLIVAKNKETGEIKYFVSNAPPHVALLRLLEVAFARWHIEKWFERAKQETGFGSFEVRTYRSLMRHWLASRIAMYFLADQTQRLRGEESADHVGAGGGRNTLAWNIWNCWPHSWALLQQRCEYYQWRNHLS